MSRNLRIIHCLRAPVGGLFRHVVDLALEQSTVGHDVGVIYDSSTVSPAIAAQLEQLNKFCRLGVRSTQMPRLLHFNDYTAYRAVINFAQETKAQILHGHGAKGGAYARLAASTLQKSKQNCLSFYTPHGGSLHYSPKSIAGRIFLGLERKLARQTNGLIFESAYSERIFSEVIGKGFCPVKIIPNGLKPDEFMPVELSPSATDFLFIGELRYLKGIDVLITAFASLKKKHPNTRLSIVGDGPDCESFKKLCHKFQISDDVIFHGRLPARLAFGLGHCMIVPSRAESFPYIVLEAAAALKPLICTDVGGINEIVAGTKTGLIEADNAASLETAMTKAIQQPQIMTEQALELQYQVRAKFTVEAMATNVTDFYLASLRR